MERFEGKTVVITGAARGLGRATAHAFAERGASLVLADILTDKLQATEAELRAEGVEVLAVSMDLGSRARCHELIRLGVERFGRIDVLCNVAAILAPDKVEDYTEEKFGALMAINLFAPFWLSQASIPHLLERNGNIVTVASSAGLMGQAYSVPYTMSKGGVIQMTRSLAMEYLHKPIRINAVAPGGMLTDMGSGTNAYPADVEPDLVQRFMPTRPMPEPALVADLIVYLASERAKNIHGACLSTDGGATAG